MYRRRPIPPAWQGLGSWAALACVLVLAAGEGWAQTSGENVLYVAPSGDDAAPGDRGDPLRTIEAAHARAEAGTVIRLLPGRYVGLHRLWGGGGTPDRPVVLTGDSLHPDSLAVLDGERAPGVDQGHGCLDLDDVHGVVVRHLAFRNCWTDAVRIARSSYVSFVGNDFRDARRAIQPTDGTHHVLVEGNTFAQDPRVWHTWAWDDLHHGENEPLAHFNGALFHPNDSDGGHVMRGNVIRDVFNGFRTKPSRLREDTNIEVYDNVFVNVRDNAIEPEEYVWNHHYYRNRLYNSRKSFSIDEVRGGAVYIWGNVQSQEAAPVLGPSSAGRGPQRISGLWKFQESALTDTVWVFNNSFYTEARVFKDLDAPFPNLRHVNNAYAFFGRGRWDLGYWEASYAFDHDCANAAPPQRARDAGQAAHAVTTDALFVDPLGPDPQGPDGVDLTLVAASPCRDAGTPLELPAFGWAQPFDGAAPDVGAFEGAPGDRTALIEGPAFRYRIPPGGDLYVERPRIVRHRLDGDGLDGGRLTLFFSVPIEASSLADDALQVYSAGTALGVRALALSADGYTLTATLVLPPDTPPVADSTLALAFDPVPVGRDGEPFTHWASTVPHAFGVAAPTSSAPPGRVPGLALDVYPNPTAGPVTLVFATPTPGPARLLVHDLLGRRVHVAEVQLGPGAARHPLDVRGLAAGVYVVRMESAGGAVVRRFTVMPR